MPTSHLWFERFSPSFFDDPLIHLSHLGLIDLSLLKKIYKDSDKDKELEQCSMSKNNKILSNSNVKSIVAPSLDVFS